MKKFAALTGDLHSLAGADLRLIALAYTLEEETVGVAHLRTVPLQVRQLSVNTIVWMNKQNRLFPPLTMGFTPKVNRQGRVNGQTKINS